jgi:predicted phosphodiesterase
VRLLILADIHANWYALESVLADAEGQYSQVVCCGDLVGYNPHPDQVVEWIQKNCKLIIRGNHDKVVAGLERLDWFNEVARVAARWTIQAMQGPNIEYLKALPTGPCSVPGFQFCHGSPLDEDEYITSNFEAQPCFDSLEVPLLFFGHSHLQGGYYFRRNKVHTLPPVKKQDHERIIELEVDTQYMLNPGSVGQPRDGDPRAAYALYDTTSKVVTLRRITYPILKTIADIRAAGLPDVLGSRLTFGF